MQQTGISPADAAAAVEFVPPAAARHLVWRELFLRKAPIEIDLGCGDGTFLAAWAEQNPDKNFLGIERLLGRVRSVGRKVASRSLTNVRVIRNDLPYVVQHLLPPDSVDVFHLLFPDPWPKRRHHRRRVMTTEFLNAVHAALTTSGTLRVATDEADYFTAIVRVVRETTLFEAGSDAEWEPLPVTTFEQRFRAAGEQIHRLVLRKVSDSR